MPTRKPSQKSVDPLSFAVGERVASLRAIRGLSPQQFAELAGMDANYLWRIEQGRQNLSLRNVARLAKALGVTFSELLEGVDVANVDLGARAYVKRASATGPAGAGGAD